MIKLKKKLKKLLKNKKKTIKKPKHYFNKSVL